MSESKQRKIGVILSYVSIFVNILIQLLYTPFLLRKLGQSEYGLYSLVASIIGYLTIMDLGLGNAIVVFTSKYKEQKKKKEEKKLHGMFNIVFKIIGVIAMFLGILLYFNVENIFGAKMTDVELDRMKIMMLILSLNLFLSFYFAIYNSIITAYEKFTFQKVIAVVQSLLRPLLMIPLLLLGCKSITLCIILTITNLITLLSNYLYCKRKLNISIKYDGFDNKLFKTIIGYSIWIFIGVIVDKINWSVDNFVLGAVSGTIAVSVYSLASVINQLFINLSTAISGILLPKISKMIAKKSSNEELTNEFVKIGRIQYYIIFLMASGLVLVGKEFFNIWGGPGYEDSYYIALLLVIPLCVPLIQNLGISIMQAKNMHRFRSLLYLFISIANIGISIPLSKLYGGIGAAVGTAGSLLIGNGIIINIYYYKKVGINVLKFWKEIFKMTLLFLIPLSFIFIFIYFVKLKGVASIIIYGGLYTLSYAIICYIFVMNKYEKTTINKIMYKLRKKKV